VTGAMSGMTPMRGFGGAGAWWPREARLQRVGRPCSSMRGQLSFGTVSRLRYVNLGGHESALERELDGGAPMEDRGSLAASVGGRCAAPGLRHICR
jgi:hypothetical protein